MNEKPIKKTPEEIERHWYETVSSNIITNLMTANVTACAASSSADLLTDLKSGYILGANPRQQFLAQFVGIFAGTAIVVPAFYILVPDAASLGTDRWPAPADQYVITVSSGLIAGESLMGVVVALAQVKGWI